MHRCLHFHLLALVVLFAAGGRLIAAGQTPSSSPSIVFILTDDQGWNSLSCYGNRLVSTPNIDRLAREGMKFPSAYVYPQCTPTRAALLTGQHTARNGMWHVIPFYNFPWARLAEPKYVENLPRQTPTLAKALKAAGYTTGIVGKWHLTDNEDGNYKLLKPEAAPHYGFDFSPEGWGPAADVSGDKAVNWLTDRSIDFIEANHDRPFFLFLSHHTIHGPVIAPAERVEKYRARGAPAEGVNNATYLAALEHMDQGVGRLLDALDRLKLADRTMVIFLSDNGGVDKWFDQAPLRGGKGTAYEGGLRVPCLIRWPGVIRPGSVSETPIHVIDFYPTLLEVASGRVPAGHMLDGLSILPLLRRSGRFERDALFWYMPLYDMLWGATPCAVIRQGDWKLIEYFGDFVPVGDAEAVRRDEYQLGRRLELYNLRDDLGETADLSAKHPERAAELSQRLHEWMASQNAPIPRLNPDYDPARPLVRPARKAK